jgi:hypothetical protein
MGVKRLSLITISDSLTVLASRWIGMVEAKGSVMRLICLLLLTLLSCSLVKAQTAPGPEAIPFNISSLDTAFAMQGAFEGEYRIYPDRIELKVTKADIRVSEHCPYKGRRLLSAVKFALATTVEPKGWRIDHSGQDYFLEHVMLPGDQYSLGELYFYIPIDSSIDLSKHWLVVQMQDTALDVPDEKLVKGYAFAHSCRCIFTGKP